MSNQVTGVKVQRVSFVSRAATRHPEDPTEPRRALLWKAEDSLPDERTDVLTEMEKRAIGRDSTLPPASDGLLTVPEIEDRQQNMTPLLADLHNDLARMRRDPETQPHVLERHERAHAALHREYRGLDEQRGLAEHVRARRADSNDAPITEAAALQKSDRTLSPLEALKVAMRADPDGYFAQSGTARPAPAAGRLAKAEADHQVDEAAVARRAAQLEKGGIKPTQAYAKALRESGVYTGAAAAA